MNEELLNRIKDKSKDPNIKTEDISNKVADSSKVTTTKISDYASYSRESFFEKYKKEVLIGLAILFIFLFIFLFFYVRSKSGTANLSATSTTQQAGSNGVIDIAEYARLHPSSYLNNSNLTNQGSGSGQNGNVNSDTNNSQTANDSNTNSDGSSQNEGSTNLGGGAGDPSSSSTNDFQFNSDKYNKDGYFNLGDTVFGNDNSSLSLGEISGTFGDFKDVMGGLFGSGSSGGGSGTDLGGSGSSATSTVGDTYQDPNDIANIYDEPSSNNLSSTQGIFWNTSGSTTNPKVQGINNLYFFYYSSLKPIWYCLDIKSTNKDCSVKSDWIKIDDSTSNDFMNAKYNLFGNWFFTLKYVPEVWGVKNPNENAEPTKARLFLKDKETSTKNPNYWVIVY